MYLSASITRGVMAFARLGMTASAPRLRMRLTSWRLSYPLSAITTLGRASASSPSAWVTSAR